MQRLTRRRSNYDIQTTDLQCSVMLFELVCINISYESRTSAYYRDINNIWSVHQCCSYSDNMHLSLTHFLIDKMNKMRSISDTIKWTTLVLVIVKSVLMEEFVGTEDSWGCQHVLWVHFMCILYVSNYSHYRVSRKK